MEFTACIISFIDIDKSNNPKCSFKYLETTDFFEWLQSQSEVETFTQMSPDYFEVCGDFSKESFDKFAKKVSDYYSGSIAMYADNCEFSEQFYRKEVTFEESWSNAYLNKEVAPILLMDSEGNPQNNSGFENVEEMLRTFYKYYSENFDDIMEQISEAIEYEEDPDISELTDASAVSYDDFRNRTDIINDILLISGQTLLVDLNADQQILDFFFSFN